MLIDLAHEFYDGMPGFKYKNDDGTVTPFRVSIKSFLTHEESRPRYQGKAEFEITEMHFHASMGTYLDAPYHRWKEGRRIGDLGLEEVVLEGVYVDARDARERQSWGAMPQIEVRGKAVLFHFGWDKFWEQEQYERFPFLDIKVIDWLIEEGTKLVGVDTLNIDDTTNPQRPAHSRLLGKDILIVENLCRLEQLRGESFRFFAVPIRAREASSMPVRAFAEVT